MFQLFFYKIFPAEKPFLLSRDGTPHHSLKQTIFHLVTKAFNLCYFNPLLCLKSGTFHVVCSLFVEILLESDPIRTLESDPLGNLIF